MRLKNQDTHAPRLLTRERFSEEAIARAGGLCVLCTAKGLSSPATETHHAMERRLFKHPDEFGGYFAENAIPVCNGCHRLCEQTIVSVEEAREAAGIQHAVLPQHLYPDSRYDKWGNQILANGMRMKGELFHDESVQKILALGGVLDLYTHLVRFPRTNHVPWSPGMTSDDRVLPGLEQFRMRRIVVTVKRDGQNTTVYPTGELHARSPDAAPNAAQGPARAEAAMWQHDIPEGWRVCLENLYRKHSIAYDDLKSWLLGFHVWADSWDDRESGRTLHNVCLPWDETKEYFDLLGVTPVEVIYDGVFDERILRAIRFDRERMEGWVVRDAGAIPYGDYSRLVGKFVREDHNHLHGSRHAAVIPNAIGASKEEPWWLDAKILGPIADQVAATGALVR